MHPASGFSPTGPPKMRAKWLLIAASLLAAAFPALAAKPPKVQWTKTFVGWGDADGQCVQQTSDGGYIAVGTTSSADSTTRDAVLLVKLSASGTTQWVKTFKGVGGMIGSSVIQTSDGGFVLAGSAAEDEWGGHWNPCLVKTDASGNEIWRSLLTNVFSASACSVVRLGDTAYTIVVKRYLGDSAVILCRTDNGGNLRWSHAYPVFYDLEARDEELSLRRTSDGGYIIGTKTLLKVDYLGAQPQLKTFGSMMNANSVIQTSDGGYAASGAMLEYSSIYLLKTNANRDCVWLRTYMASEASRGHWVEQTAGGGYIVAGTSRDSSLNDKVTLVRTQPNGTLDWTVTLFDGDGYCVRQTADGGFIVCGVYYDPTAGPEGTEFLFVTKLATESEKQR